MESDSPKRETEISKAMVNLSKEVECLTESVGATEVRLSGVTRGRLEGVPDKKLAEPLYSTQLAQSIYKIHDKVMTLRDRLDDLLNRVEL